MRKRLASYCAVLCFIICSITCGPTSVSAIWTVDDIADQIQDDLDNMQPSSPAVSDLPSADIQPGYYDVPVVTSIGLDSGDWKLLSGTFAFGVGGSTSVLNSRYNVPVGATGSFGGDTGALLGTTTRGSNSKVQYPRIHAVDASFQLLTGDEVQAGSYYLAGNISLKATCKAPNGSSVNAPFTNLKVYDSVGKLIDTMVLGDDGYFYSSTSELVTVSASGPVYFVSTLTASYIGPDSVGSSSSTVISCYLYFDDQLTFSRFVEDPVYNGLLKSILEWLKSIKSGISGVASAVANLPGLIVDGIKGLFIPSQDALQSLKGNYETLFEGKFGFIYQLYNWVVTFFGDLKTALTSGVAYAFSFPGIAFPMDGKTITILPETPVSLDNSAMTVLRPVLGTAVSFIVVVATVNTCRRFILRFLSGHIFGGGGDEV